MLSCSAIYANISCAEYVKKTSEICRCCWYICESVIMKVMDRVIYQITIRVIFVKFSTVYTSDLRQKFRIFTLGVNGKIMDSIVYPNYPPNDITLHFSNNICNRLKNNRKTVTQPSVANSVNFFVYWLL